MREAALRGGYEILLSALFPGRRVREFTATFNDASSALGWTPYTETK